MATIEAALSEARRRARLALFVRSASLAGCAGLSLGALIALAGWAPAWLTLVLGAAGAAAAAVWTAVHTPSPEAMARTLDARLGLRDLIAAAWQLRGDDRPVAALVARDAAARLAAAPLADVLPIRLTTASAIMIPLAAFLVTWLEWIGPAVPDRPGGAATAATADNATTTAAADNQSSRSTPAARSAETAASGQTSPARAEGPRGTAPREDRAGRPSAPEARGARGDSNTASAGSKAGASSNEIRTAGTPGSDTTQARPAAGTTRESARGGAGSTATVTRRTTEGAGGVAGAAPAGAVVSKERSPAGGAASAAVARTRAEAALARDVIPPDYRDDVRAYFRAIERGGAR